MLLAATCGAGASRTEGSTAPPEVAPSRHADPARRAPGRDAAGTDDTILEWALRRYELAGLAVPPVAVDTHDDRSGCDGHVAVFIPADPVPEIHLCFDADAPELLRQRVVLHEVAHAWTHAHLTDDERSEFVRMRGLEHWRGPARWFEQGTEHAAEIIAWGLLETDVGVLTVAPNDPVGLRDAFRFLTGVEPVCRPPGG